MGVHVTLHRYPTSDRIVTTREEGLGQVFLEGARLEVREEDRILSTCTFKTFRTQFLLPQYHTFLEPRNLVMSLPSTDG